MLQVGKPTQKLFLEHRAVGASDVGEKSGHAPHQTASLSVNLQVSPGVGILAVRTSTLFAMGVEEQKEEREVLESIFADEITGTQPLVAQKHHCTPSRYTNHDLQTFPRQSSESQSNSTTDGTKTKSAKMTNVCASSHISKHHTQAYLKDTQQSSSSMSPTHPTTPMKPPAST